MAVLILLPSSAVAAFPAGSYYPIIISGGVLMLGLAASSKRLRWPPMGGWLLAFFIAVTVSTFVYSTASTDQLDWFYLLIPLVAFPTFHLTYSASPRERFGITQTLILIALTQAVLSVFEVLGRTGPILGVPFLLSPDNPFLPGYPRAQGTLGHPIVLAFVLLVAMGLVLARRTRAVARLAVAAVLLTGLAATGSTGGVLGGLVIMVFWMLVRRSPAGSIFMVIGLLIVALLAWDSGYPQAILAEELDARNFGHRMNSISAIVPLALGQEVVPALFGRGLFGVSDLYTAGIVFNDGFFTLDNQFVSVLAQAGIIGLVLFVVTVGGLTARMARNGHRRYLPGWLGLIVAMGMTFDFMSWYVAATLFLIYAAIAVAPNSADEKEDHLRGTPSADDAVASAAHPHIKPGTSPHRSTLPATVSFS
ncbi:O-antigen ligase family protein [Microbacterium wangchenii]|uniref:O-antigen ligase family protein n=1 Tax=Microbacterium wangchenii TaxID=2541726 RepID=UPI00164EF69E|nr:O-antigen ligase family protein [Microbacterium wangchenii]